MWMVFMVLYPNNYLWIIARILASIPPFLSNTVFILVSILLISQVSQANAKCSSTPKSGNCLDITSLGDRRSHVKSYSDTLIFQL